MVLYYFSRWIFVSVVHNHVKTSLLLIKHNSSFNMFQETFIVQLPNLCPLSMYAFVYVCAILILGRSINLHIHRLFAWRFSLTCTYKILNQRLSRACIVHLVIKKNNWSYVKTMSCVILELRST